jgi:signal transduction histidine kinase
MTMSQPSPDRVRIWRASVTKWQIKVVLTVFGLGIIASVLLYTKAIVDELIANEHRTVELYANLMKRSYMATTDEDILFYVDLTYSSIHFPVILTDRSERPVYPYQQFILNVDLDSTLPVQRQRDALAALIHEMKQEYPPFEITDPNGKVVQKVFYTNSAIVSRLKYMPYVEIMIVTAFIMIGYVAFSTIKRNEESNIWVGMAKEAAHQLGTPLSSMLAWLDILRMNQNDASMVVTTANEMGRDVERLNVIANRFSKIGSKPKLEHVVVADVIENVVRYFESRLPNLGRKVVLKRDLDPAITCDISIDLFEWVIENLIKNAAEAIERQDGAIEITLWKRAKGGVVITVHDNGKGMSAQVRSKVFEPGYTTKKRGWGLGLSLSRRIIEDYHNGKIFIKESIPGQGTTFQIELPS